VPRLQTGGVVTMTANNDARHRPVSDVDRMRADATRAAQVRELTTHPDVVALQVEKVRRQVDGLIWAGLLLGLAFTMVNVQTFAAAGAVVASLAWIAAWLLDPMVSLVLIAVLRAEQVTARWQVDTGPWVRRTKVFAFAATYVMNTWVSWSHLDAAGIVLHSVPPLLVYCAAETGPVLRDRLTEAVLRAARTVAPPTTTTAPGTVPVAVPALVGETFTNTDVDGPANTTASVPEPTPALVREQRSRKPANRRRPATVKPSRKLLADYVAEAREHHTPGVVVTPAWVRGVCPDIGRGTSTAVAAALNTDRQDDDLIHDIAGEQREPVLEGVTT